MAIERKTCREVFARIDLIFILAIIAILVVMIVPMLIRNHKLGLRSRSIAFSQELVAAAQSYHKDTNYHPGIRYPHLLAGWRDKKGKKTGGLSGSQVLAASIFGLYYKGVNDGDPNNDGITKTKSGSYTASVYVTYIRQKVIDEINFDLSDQYPEPMPILYYVIGGRAGEDNLGLCFEDNNIPRYSVYGFSSCKDQCSKLVSQIYDSMEDHPLFGKYLWFVTVGPGIDRIYFTEDDIENYGG